MSFKFSHILLLFQHITRKTLWMCKHMCVHSLYNGKMKILSLHILFVCLYFSFEICFHSNFYSELLIIYIIWSCAVCFTHCIFQNTLTNTTLRINMIPLTYCKPAQLICNAISPTSNKLRILKHARIS